MKYLKKAVDNLKYHVVNTTAILTESNPVFSAFEVYVGFSNAASINARLLTAATFYLGMGQLANKGRDLSRKLFRITDKPKEIILGIHDIAYTIAFGLVTSAPMYAISQILAGENIDLNQIKIGAGVASVLGAANGFPLWYAVDVFGDLSGMKECNRPSYPDFLKRQSPKVKKLTLAGFIGASIGAMGLVYSLAPNAEHRTAFHERPAIEERVNVSDITSKKNLENLVSNHFVIASDP